MSPSIVILARVPEYGHQEVERAVTDALGFDGLDAGVLAPGAAVDGGETATGDGPVLLKPNMLAGVPAERAVTTHPVLFSAVARALGERGLPLAYGDSPGFESGADVHWPHGVVHRRRHVARGVLASRGLVNLTKLKTHGLTAVTGALKNLFGVIAGFRKAEYHMTHPDLAGFSQMLADLNALVCSGLAVMDAIDAMEGNGPRNGLIRPLGLLLVSRDPVAVDSVACRIMGIEPRSVPLLAMAEEAGVGAASADRIEVRGEPLELVATEAFSRPPHHLAADFPGLLYRFAKLLMVPRPVILPEACTRCGVCVAACPARPKALRQAAGGGEAGSLPRYDYGACIRCCCCQELCPYGAIEIRDAPLAWLFPRG